MLGLGGLEPPTSPLSLISLAWLGFTTTYKTAGTAKLQGSHIKLKFYGLGFGLNKGCNLRRSANYRLNTPFSQRQSFCAGLLRLRSRP
jgi:hypothetical protein